MRNDFIKPVKKVALTDLLPEFATNSYNSHAIVVQQEDGSNKIVNACSEEYGVVANADLLSVLENQISKFFDYDVSFTNEQDARFFATFKLKDAISLGKDGEVADTVRPTLVIQNSYNSSMSFQASFGFYRQICSNGLWGMKYDKVKFSHLEGNLERIGEQTMEGLNSFLKEYHDITEKHKMLSSRKVKQSLLEERVDQIIEGTGFYKMSEEIVARVLQEKKELKTTMNDWLIYNAFNYQLNHNSGAQLAQRMRKDEEVFSFLTAEENYLQ